jgi:hypothetical protein
MNFLPLCQRVASECGISQTAPTAVASQTGRLAQVVNWTKDADVDIQTLHDDWKFMRSTFTVATTSGDGKYAYGDCTDTVASAAISKFRTWCRDTPLKIYLTSAGQASETDLAYLPYEDWYARYNLGNQTNSYPVFWSIDRDNALLLAPKPDGIYTVSGDYMKSATEMSVDASEPAFPSDYHMAVVYRAMMKYGRFAGASEVYTDGYNEFQRVLRQMRRTQLPDPCTPGPLA